MRETSSVQPVGSRAAASRGTLWAARNRRQNGGSDAVHCAVGWMTGPGTVRNAPAPRAGSGITQERAICEKPARCSLRDRVQQRHYGREKSSPERWIERCSRCCWADSRVRRYQKRPSTADRLGTTQERAICARNQLGAAARSPSSRDTPAARNRRQNGGSDAAHGAVG